MKSFINKMFAPDPAKPDERQNPGVGLPVPVSVHSLHENQKRAAAGWIANRVGQLLQKDKFETGQLIYLSFAKESFSEDRQDDLEYPIYLASRMVGWICENHDIYLKIREMKLPDKYHVSLLKVYEEIKDQIGRYVPEVNPSPSLSTVSKETEVWQVYRDVIFAATQGKFLLIDQNDVIPYKQGRLVCESDIRERSDIPKARDLAKQCLLDKGVSPTMVMSRLLIISEAVTNILKHAEYGTMSIYEGNASLNVIVQDRGPGFPLQLLPKTVLMAGYSTKKSLGQGFTLMLKMTDQVLLSTIPETGSTLILVFNSEGGGGTPC